MTTENLATGAFSGSDVAPSGATFTLTGTITGNHLVETASQGGYISHGQATITGTHGTGTFTDNNGTQGTFTLTRLSGPPTSTPPASDETTQVCLPDCSEGVDVEVDVGLDPGDTTETIEAGCGARITGSARLARGLTPSCLIDAIVDATRDPLSPTVQQAIQRALNQADGGLIALDIGGGVMQQVINASSNPTLSPIQSTEINDLIRKWYDDLQNTESPSVAPALETADASLAPDFPAGDRGTASASAAQLSLRPMPNPSLVLQSVDSQLPSAAAIAAYKAAVKLATASTYTPARAVARFTLLLAVSVGRRTLSYDLRAKPGRVVVASAKTTVLAHHKKKLTLRATPLGGRVLRVLGVVGLSHKSAGVRLVLNTSSKGKPAHATRSIRIR